MTVVVKPRTELVVPASVRRRAGIKAGDKIEFKVSDGVIHIIPKAPPLVDEYTPAQRRAIDRELAEGLEDIKNGRVQGPFQSHKEFIASLHEEARKLAAKRPKRPAR